MNFAQLQFLDHLCRQTRLLLDGILEPFLGLIRISSSHII